MKNSMRKFLFIAVLGFAFMSCEKSWDCHCVGTNHIEGEVTDVDYTSQIHATKKKAATLCKDASRHHSVADIDCELK